MNASTKVLSIVPRVSNAITFARRFKVNVPPGALFYPQCGNDSGEVLLQFMDSVSEFHFVDREQVPVLPALYCRGDHQTSRFASATQRHIFPAEIVTAARSLSSSHPSFLNQARIYDNGRYAGKDRISYESTDEIWTVANLESRIRIYSHRFDELESLKALSSISVFYCPGLAPNKTEYYFNGVNPLGEPAGAVRSLRLVRDGEEHIAPNIYNYNQTAREDRRSQWFEPENSVKVLDKLNDGGIIVAGACIEARCDLLWRRLGRQVARWRDGCDRSRRPENFTYANRRFRCLGECGYRSGPIFAWQVFRLS